MQEHKAPRDHKAIQNALSMTGGRLAPLLSEHDEKRIAKLAKTAAERLQLEKESSIYQTQILTQTPLPDACVIVVDDYSPLLGADQARMRYRAARAWVRTKRQDVLISPVNSMTSYTHYLRERLGLHVAEHVQIIEGNPPFSTGSLGRLLNDQHAQRRLERLLEGRARILHPYIGSRQAWEAAKKVSSKENPCSVAAPLPCVARLANDKSLFLDAAGKVLGSEWIIEWTQTETPAACAFAVQRLFEQWEKVALRLGHGAAGVGTWLLSREQARSLSTEQLEAKILTWLNKFSWKQEMDWNLQVSGWQPQVIVSPSVHFWIPPIETGYPTLERITDQIFDSEEQQCCIGSCPTSQPEEVVRLIEEAAVKLTRFFQHLSYVGRCSFDTIVYLTEEQELDVKFVECNGRWGATTMVLCLLHRIFDTPKAYWHQKVHLASLQGMQFDRLCARLRDVLYDKGSGKGWLILHNVCCLEPFGEFDAITIGDSPEHARKRMLEVKDLLTDWY